MQGALIYNDQTDRMDIRFGINDYYGGLHCGDCLDVMVNNRWHPTRIEYFDGKWVLIGIKAINLVGLRVRI